MSSLSLTLLVILLALTSISLHLATGTHRPLVRYSSRALATGTVSLGLYTFTTSF